MHKNFLDSKIIVIFAIQKQTLTKTITAMTQNIIPTEIVVTIANLNKQFDDFVKRVDPYKVPNIIRTIVELGVENVFYMHQFYKGLYNDDYCDFYYWDNVNGKVISDHWTTSFSCPCFDLFTDNIFTFEDALNAGMVNIDLLKKYNIEKVLNYVESTRNLKNVNGIIKENYPLVKVEGGRKFRGVGYYVGEVVTAHGSYYPATVEAKIFSLEDFQIHYCNPQYVQLIDGDTIVDNYIMWASEIINNVVKNNSYATFFNMNGVDWSVRDEKFSFESYVKSQVDPNIKQLIENAYDPREEELKKKRAEKMTQRYADVLEWVKTKTDKKTEADQIALAIRILQKNY